MANGSKGDNPITDMLLHGLHPFPSDIEHLLRDVFALDPAFPDGKRRWIDQMWWEELLDAMAAGNRHDEGRAALARILAELRNRDCE